MNSAHRPSSPWAEPAAWLLALAIAAAAFAAAGYRTHDPDSALHIAIETDLAAGPATAWIAPTWNGHWNGEGFYREHPVGTFIPPVLLIRAGYPAAQAGYAVNALYQALCLVLIVLLARLFAPRRDARALAWLLLLLPVSLGYAIRANHEHPLLFFTLLAMYGTLRAADGARFAALVPAGVVGALLVKGVFALPVWLACAASLVLYSHVQRRSGRETRTGAAWAALAAACVLAGAVAIGYERLYVEVTGESFIAEYLRRQVGLAALQRPGWWWIAGQKAYNVLWYLSRIAWYAFPWSALLLIAWVQGRRWRLDGRPQGAPLRRMPAASSSMDTAFAGASFSAHDDARPHDDANSHDDARPHDDANSHDDARRHDDARSHDGFGPHDVAPWRDRLNPRGGLVVALGAAALWTALFCLSDRRADRYIFPVYFLVAGAGVGLALERHERLRRFAARLERLAPFELPGTWLVLLLVNLVLVSLGVLPL